MHITLRWIIIAIVICSGGGVIQAMPTPCDSCQFKIENLDRPFSLMGNWLFTREDQERNKDLSIDLSYWKMVKTPGSWKNIYPDGNNFKVGWYRGVLDFSPQLIGKEVLLLLDTYMSPVTVFLDGNNIYQRLGQTSHEQYHSVQPIPIRFKITQTQHLLAFRIQTVLMTGIYQLPFELREYKERDLEVALYQFWGGDLREIIAHVVLFFGLFFCMIYVKTRYSFYWIAGLTGIVVYPFNAFPTDSFITLFPPDQLFMLHYIGIGATAFLHNLVAQHFYKSYPQLNWINGLSILAITLGYCYLAFDFHFDLYQKLRSLLFLYSLLIAFHTNYILVRGLFNEEANNHDKFILLIGEGLFFLIALHDALLAFGFIQSAGMLFTGTLIATLSILWVISRQFAEAFIENKKQIQELSAINDSCQKYIDMLHQLNQIGVDIVNAKDAHKLLHAIPKDLQTQVGISRVTLYLVEENQLLWFHTLPAFGSRKPGKVIKFGEGAIGKAATNKSYLYISDSMVDREYPIFPPPTERSSLLCLPLISEDNVSGVFVVSGNPHHFPPGSVERRVVETLGQYLSAALPHCQATQSSQSAPEKTA
ncbi:GAF domain-containing protein [Deltaproteobacteria bacterium TL4]